MTRIQKARTAIEAGGALTFDYMRIGGGRKSIEQRIVRPLSVEPSKNGRIIVTGEDAGREGKPRSFRLERMFHVNLMEVSQ